MRAAVQPEVARGQLSPVETFTFDGFRGSIARDHRPEDLPEEVARLLDPAAAVQTLHWGRNYIYEAHLRSRRGPIPVAVKQFRNAGLKRRLRRRFEGSKAEKSWEVARAMLKAGVLTPEPILLAESLQPDGPSFYVCRQIADAFEARYLLRAVNAGEEEERFPWVDVELFMGALGRFLRRLHDAGFWHRDVSSGNILVRWQEGRDPDLYLLDLNRTRQCRMTLVRRSKDLCRLMIFRPDHQALFLRAYWGEGASAFAVKKGLFLLYHHGYRLKHRVKNRWKGFLKRMRGLLFSRTTHPHIPRAPEDAATPDRVVWDHLSDQPHLHAGRWEKLRVRLGDAGSHLAQLRAAVTAVPRVVRRYRELRRELYRRPVPWVGAGVALRPWPERPEVLLKAVEDLGARSILLRLHPWQSEHVAEESLARELSARGYELSFALPQNRDLVKDPARWRGSLEELAERFSPYGKAFQVGQAPNRSKWGVWNVKEYLSLVEAAGEVFSRYPGTQLLGPAVIDFEPHATTGILNLPQARIHFEALASLLYVDRRGAPENRQMGFDTVDKTVLLKAIADTARNCEGRSWITEVNWPLWEGPHSPAGKSVSVDEETQADYLVRYYLLTLGTGLVERVFWWQMVAKGYGLVDPARQARRRPSFQAFSTLVAQLAGCVFEGPLAAPEGAHLYRFTSGTGGELVVGWAESGKVSAQLPRGIETVVLRSGEQTTKPEGPTARLGPAPCYFWLERA